MLLTTLAGMLQVAQLHSNKFIYKAHCCCCFFLKNIKGVQVRPLVRKIRCIWKKAVKWLSNGLLASTPTLLFIVSLVLPCFRPWRCCSPTLSSWLLQYFSASFWSRRFHHWFLTVTFISFISASSKHNHPRVWVVVAPSWGDTNNYDIKY